MKNNLPVLTNDRQPRNLRDGWIHNTMRLLVVSPHPDDFDAIGSTLKFLAGNGNPLRAVVTHGGSGIEDSYRPGATLAEKRALRENEQRNSLRFFGLPENCLTFFRSNSDTDDQPMDEMENLSTLEALVRQKTPDIIFLPHHNDKNNGHRVIYSLVRQIAIRSKLPLALLLNSDPKTISMHTDFYFAFDEDEAAWKAKLHRFHDTQHQRNLNTRGYGLDERVLRHNRHLARELALTEPYAEAFELETYNYSTQ